MKDDILLTGQHFNPEFTDECRAKIEHLWEGMKMMMTKSIHASKIQERVDWLTKAKEIDGEK